MNLLHFPASHTYEMEMTVIIKLIGSLVLIKVMLSKDTAFTKKLPRVLDRRSANTILPLNVTVKLVYIEMHTLLKRLVEDREPFGSLPHLLRFYILCKPLPQMLSQFSADH